MSMDKRVSETKNESIRMGRFSMFSTIKSPSFLKRCKYGLLAIFIICLISIAYAQDYGYMLAADSRAAVWWAEGAFKVMKQDPPPKARSAEVRLYCARNEYEPFILVLRPKMRLDYTSDPKALLEYRKRVAAILEKLWSDR